MTPARLAAGAAAALALAGAAAWLTSASDHVQAWAAGNAFAIVAGLSFAATGLAALWLRPDNRTGKLLAATGYLWFFGALAASSNEWLFATGVALEPVALATFVHLVLAYPSGYLQSQLERLVVAATYALVWGGGLFGLLVDPRPAGETCLECPDNPVAVTDSALANRLVDGTVTVLAVLVLAATVAILARRWQTAPAPVRRVLWPTYATGAAAAALLLAALVGQQISDAVADPFVWLFLAAFAMVPLAFLVGVLRSRLARGAVGQLLVDLGTTRDPEALREAIAAALRDTTLEVAYAVDGTWVNASGRELDLPEPGSGRLATLVEHDGQRVAVLIHDESLAGEPELLHAVATAAALSLQSEHRLQRLAASERRQRALLDAIPDMMFRVTRDGLYLDVNVKDEGLLTRRLETYIGSTVHRSLPPDLADMIMRGVEQAIDEGGVVELEYRIQRRIGLRDSEARIVASGPDEAVIIVRDVTDRKRQEEELRASRARLVRASDEARRRLERNLHDGAQQRLVSLSVALRLAEKRVRDDPDEAEKILTSARAELALALDELRELARGIHPAVLTDRGLGPALELLVGRAPVPVDVEVPDERLPPEIEAAAYYVVSESLANMAKHAGASQASVRVAVEDGQMLVEVADDGRGGADPASGSGLRGLADRVAALDGTLELESPRSGGTRVRVVMPCEQPVRPVVGLG